MIFPEEGEILNGQAQEIDPVAAWLRGCAKERQGWQYYRYDDKDDFQELWKGWNWISADAEHATAVCLLIDWNGYPSDYPAFPRVVEFLTPLDWALALTYEQVEADSRQAGLPRIVIVDRFSHRHPGCFAVEMRRALVDALSGHVCIFSALDGLEDALAFTDILENAGKPSPDSTAHRIPRLGQLRALCQAWIGYTLQSHDHHDINNLIGPLLLARGSRTQYGSDAMHPLENALLQLVERLGIAPSDDCRFEGLVLGTSMKDVLAQGRVATVLIDDHADRWSGFLKNTFLGSDARYCEVSKPTELLRSLSTVSAAPPFERSLPIGDYCAKEDQILFLDLRFFSYGDPRERFFFKEVCEVILARTNAPSWRNDSHFRTEPMSARDHYLFSQDEWCAASPLDDLDPERPFFPQAAKRVLECDAISWDAIMDSRLHDNLVTLFPRLLAQVLFTVPIVLFSSTGRRDLTEFFKGYGNIVTVFEKPRTPFRPSQVARSFQAALDQAARILKARRMLRKFAQHETTLRHQNPGGNKYYHVELYIDEYHPNNNNPNNVWVGGFYAVFEAEDLDTARTKALDFDDALYNNGVAYFTRWPYGDRIETKDKHTFVRNELSNVLSDQACAAKWVGRARIKYNGTNAGDASVTTGDDAYRRALSVLIEAFLCEVMPIHFCNMGPSRVSFSVFAGTRVTSADPGDRDRLGRLYSAAYHWGFEIDDNPDGSKRLESLNRSTLAPIIVDLKDFRRVPWEIDRAIAVRMIYDYDRDKRGPNIAPHGTLVCRACKAVVSVKMSKLLSIGPPSDARGEWGRVQSIGTDRRNQSFARINLYNGDLMQRHLTATSARSWVMCHSSRWGDFNVSCNQDVLVSLNWSDEWGYRVDRVHEHRPAAADAQGSARGIVWDQLEACPECVTPTSLRPDYPSGLYLADEMVSQSINANAGYGTVIALGPLDFDDRYDAGLRCMMEAGRLVDTGDRVQAALRMAAAENHRDANSAGKAVVPLGDRIRERLASSYEFLSGEEFERFAVGLDLMEKEQKQASNLPSSRSDDIEGD